MAQKRSFSSLIALSAAALLGMAVGYGVEAGADERGVTVSGRSGDPALSGERQRQGADRREVRRSFEAGRRDDVRATRRGRDPRDRDRGDLDRDFRDRDRGFRDIDKPNRRIAAFGSFVHVYATYGHDAGANGFVQTPTGRTGFTREGFGSSIGYDAHDPFGGTIDAFPSEPKIIDVETARLDRRPIGQSGIDIVHTGGAKIIRIAPGYGRTPERQATLSARPKPAARTDLQPWSAGWLRHCENAYHSFDPELGTYIAGDGRVRFCQPD